ncbi:MAG: extracellular solute-binding protein [Pseudomonadales bacterium]
MLKPLFLSILLLFTVSGPLQAATEVKNVHAIAMHGAPKYPADFKHFDYADPAAKKGGQLRLAAVSSSGFDSLNPFIIKGVPAAGLTLLGHSYFYDSLTVQSDDEAFTQYGLIAERMQMPEDRSWIIFHINPKARFQDGHPIQAEDVLYTFELLTTQGHPLYAAYYRDVAKSEALDDLTVKFTFSDNQNKELPLIMGQLPVLPKHYWENRKFNQSSLDIPLGSGAYRIKSVDPGRSIVYERVKDYWAADLPVNRGRYNFDEISYDYYRDGNVALEALKSDEFDLRVENTAKTWHSAYTGPQFESGRLLKEEIAHQNPTGMQAFVFNTRRSQFSDPRVRQALAYAFDFEWTNKQIFYSSYTRTESFFSNSELASSGLPSPQELAILEPFREQLPAQVFTQAYHPPTNAGDGNIRKNLLKAIQLLEQAGWVIKDNQLTHLASGEVMKFEMMLVVPEFQRVVLPFKKNLERLGIQVDIRLVDPQQYINRINNFDFDLIVGSIAQSSSPGNEQRDFWLSSEAERPGSRNWIGIKNPVVDQLIELIIKAPDREALIHRTRALDRVLLWGHYVIPLYHLRSYRVAYWNRFERPEINPKFALGVDNWWFKGENTAAETQQEK